MKINIQFIIAGVFGFLGVAIGAFGAHSFKNTLFELGTLDSFKTGVQYHLVHTAILFAIAVSGRNEFVKAYLFFLIGIVLFSFSLYVYSLTKIKIFAIITPIGGLSFLAGWGLIIYESIKLR